jgi:hypothetical protein
MFGIVQKDLQTNNSGTRGVVTCGKLVCENAIITNLNSAQGNLLVNPNLELVTVKGYLPNNYVAAGISTQLLNSVSNAPVATAITDPQVLVLPENAVLLQCFIYTESAMISPSSTLNLGLSQYPPALAFKFAETSETNKFGLGVRSWGLLPPYPTTFGTVGAFWDTTVLTTNDTTGVAYQLNDPVFSGDFIVQLTYVVAPASYIPPPPA